MIKIIHDVRWTILTTLSIGAFFLSGAKDYVLFTYSTQFATTYPVTVMQGTLITRDDSGATIRINSVEKRRCVFVSPKDTIPNNIERLSLYK